MNFLQISEKYLCGDLTGSDLAKLQEQGKLSKAERRRIVKAGQKARSKGEKEEKFSGDASVGEKRKISEDEGFEETGEEEKEESTKSGEDKEKFGLSNKQLKMKLKLLNKELRTFALKKQLNEAKKKLKAGLRKGMVPDVHTYTNMINCYVRCNDLQGAQNMLNTMKAKQINPNVVTLTTLLKGYCDVGDMENGKQVILHDMLQVHLQSGQVKDTGNDNNGITQQSKKKKKKDKIIEVDYSLWPNSRTMATFLRGCLRTGSVDLGEKVYALWSSRSTNDTNTNSQDKQKDNEDNNEDEDDSEESTTLAVKLYMICLYCQCFRIREALSLAESSGLEIGGLLLDSDTLVREQLPSSHFNMDVPDEEEDGEKGINMYKSTVSDSMSGHNYRSPVLNKYYTAQFPTVSHAHICLHLTRTFFLMGLYRLAERAAKLTKRVLDESKQAKIYLNMRAGTTQTPKPNFGSSNDASKDSKDTSKAYELFQEHQMAEIDHELNLLKGATRAAVETQNENKDRSGVMQDYPTQEKALNWMCIQLSQCLIFGYDGRGDLFISGDSENEQDNSMTWALKALDAKFGLYNLLEWISPLHNNKMQVNIRERVNRYLNGCRHKIEETLNSDMSNTIDFSHLFKTFQLPDLDGQYMPPVDTSQNSKGNNIGNLDDNSWQAVVKRRPHLPVKLEIGSGTGEWVIAQAKRDVGKANWIALELRTDRAYSILNQQLMNLSIGSGKGGNSKRQKSDATMSLTPHASDSQYTAMGITSEQSNLAIFSGDADKIIGNHMSAQSLSNIYINHPEPPERTMMVDKQNQQQHAKNNNVKANSLVQGKHLLTSSFMQQLCRVLLPTGTVTIITDSLPYAKLLAEILSDIPPVGNHLFRSVLSDEEDGDMETLKMEYRTAVTLPPTISKEKKGVPSTIVVYRGDPDEQFGSIDTGASSYFDRLWDKGNKKRRFFLHVEKFRV